MQTQIGVNGELFQPDQEVRDRMRSELGFEDNFVIGYTGRLTRDKGVDTLLEALEGAEFDWKLLVVGDGDMRPDIEDRIAHNHWEHRVHITGYVPQTEVPRYMQAMDTFVLASKTQPHWVDTFPLSSVQAMACEVPIVISDSGALPFQVGDAGLVFPERNADALRERIRQLALNYKQRAELATAGRERSLERFGMETLADNFYKILQQVIQGEYVLNVGNEYVQHEAYQN